MTAGTGADPQVGQRYSAVVVDGLTRTQLVMYAGASGDFHPFHHDEPFAQAKGYPGVFAHGMLTMGVTGRLLTEVFGPARLVRYGADFTRPVWPGDTLTATATVTAVGDDTVDLDLATTNQDGAVVLRGTAIVRQPGR